MFPYGPAVLRLAVGAIFIAHGAQKLFGVWGGGPAETAASLTELGLSPAYPLALLIGVVELIGGLMLVIGAFTLVAALALAIDVGAVAWKAYVPGDYLVNAFPLLLIASLVSLMLTGAGAFSIDRRRASSAEAEAAGRARLRAGKV
jgi:putative oxidoreductase